MQNLSEQPLQPEQIRERMIKDPSYLPSHEEVVRGFTEQDRWKDYTKNNPVYEVLTREFIEALANYLVNRITELSAGKEQPLVIVELGAGDGRLSHFLQAALENKIKGKFNLIPTDSGKWEAVKPAFPVEKVVSNNEALIKHKPKIVINSWMPKGEDWSVAMRSTPSVEEYILIGQDVCCGDVWETWGYEPPGEDPNDYIHLTPPYEAGGFKAVSLGWGFQIGRNDPSPNQSYTSRTMSFRRKK